MIINMTNVKLFSIEYGFGSLYNADKNIYKLEKHSPKVVLDNVAVDRLKSNMQQMMSQFYVLRRCSNLLKQLISCLKLQKKDWLSLKI